MSVIAFAVATLSLYWGETSEDWLPSPISSPKTRLMNIGKPTCTFLSDSPPAGYPPQWKHFSWQFAYHPLHGYRLHWGTWMLLMLVPSAFADLHIAVGRNLCQTYHRCPNHQCPNHQCPNHQCPNHRCPNHRCHNHRYLKELRLGIHRR